MMRSIAIAILLPTVACSNWTEDLAGPSCAGPYCDVECTTNAGCPAGSWCDDSGHCTNVTGGCDEDPDGDGYCECCPLGPDCREGDKAVHPGADEVCDGLDNDCDGNIDGVGCAVDTHGNSTPFDDDGKAGGIVDNPDGSITLGSTNVASDFAWPSNDLEGTVSRVDTIRNVEVGRYPSVLRIAGANPGAPGAIPNVSEWDSGCNRPSRSTVDLAGNAYVANRAHEGDCDRQQGHVTKIGFYDADLCALSVEQCQCKDRNGNGVIETSQDLNGDGSISLVADDGEFLAYDDECLLWTVPIGGSTSNARAMAIDASGYLWVGDWKGRKFFKLDPRNGSLINPIDPDHPATGEGLPVDGQPYGAVIDSQGTLWYVNGHNTGELQSVDTRTGAVGAMVTDNPTGGYGITIDRKDRVWMASWDDTSNAGTVARYTPSTSSWDTFSAGLGESFTGRGITATTAGKTDTGAGIAWGVFHSGSNAQLVGFDDDTGEVWDSIDLDARCGAHTCIGAGIGTGDSVWVVNQNSDNVCRYDPDSDNVIEIPIGYAPYTYSDFTGNVLRTFTAPQGTYRLLLEGCPGAEPRVTWSAVIWDGTTPGGSSIEVRARFADTIDGLATATPVDPATQPPDRQLLLSGVTGRFVEVVVTLIADDNGNVPSLTSITVGRVCSEDPA